MSKTILITGANGNVSSGIIASLKGSGATLRAMVRSREKGQALAAQGVELVEGDLERPRSLGAAFAGVDTVWLLSPPGPRAPEQASNGLWAARQAGARYVVRMSAVGAAHDAPTINSRMHALSDAELRASGIAYTILKPQFFMQNLLMSARTALSDGALYFSFADARTGMIDARDIGEFAARVLTSTGHEGKTYTLSGPRSIDMSEVAGAFGRALGREVKYVPVPIEAAVQAMAHMGADEWMQNAMADYFAAYSKGWGDLVTDEIPKLLGRPARSIDDFARDLLAPMAK
jgi:uncharacterized protein YbjT (DUF2867 family)